MSGYPHLPPPPPRQHSTHHLMPIANPSTRTTKTRSGTPIRCCGAPRPRLCRMARCPPPPPPPYGAPPFATSELPELQPKALLGPFTNVAQIKKVRGQLRNQPDCTSSVAAFNAWFVRSREAHVCGDPLWCAKCFAARWPACVSTGSAGDQRDAGRSAPSRNSRCHGGAEGCCAGCLHPS